QAFSKAIEDHSLKIISSPQMDPPDLDPESAYCFEMTIEVKPEIDDVEYEGMELNKTLYEVSDDEIEAQIQMIRKTMATKQAVSEERAVKDDDFVLIDYQGFVGDEPFAPTPQIENFTMAVGTDSMPKEFSEKIVGVIPEQDLEIEVAYPDDGADKEIAGKTVMYKVKVKEIHEEVMPEDDHLVKELGKYESLDQVKDDIRANLSQGYIQRVQHELSEQIFQNLLSKYEFEVPESLVEAELNGIIAEAEQAYQQNNMTFEDAGMSKDSLRKDYKDVAEKQARRHLILDKIIEQEKLEMTDQEIEKSFEEMAKGMNASVDAIKNYFNMDKNQLENYKHTQLEKKAVELIVEKGKVTEKPPEKEESADTKKETEKKKPAAKKAAAKKPAAKKTAAKKTVAKKTKKETEK
ncbi:MAG: trigger factor, partial [Desulfobacteraceae bacterium]|nr:trigger factor [Desulfobacteraceae bacterium]